jgi:hypothetical protein
MSRISFQNEQPSDLDVFPGGSHDKVASAMCDYIVDQQNSRVIGLDGEFGSGKSSILRMLQNKLDKVDQSYRVWFFDCEQNYQGSIKSNFIELFTDELIKASGSDVNLKESLRDSRDKALGRHFTYTKNTVSRISSWALLLIVALFFSTSSFKELFAVSKMTAPISFWVYAVHVLSFLSPLLVLLVAHYKLKGTFVGDQPWSVFHLFKGGSDDTVTEKIQVAKEVTPLDLKRTLDADLKLMKSMHYVVILDNLDRLPKDSLRAVWSDLEIFTWASEGNNLTVIVPFCSNKVAKYLAADHERTYDSRDFIAKKFPVVFRAPPIIAAGWKDGFYKLWESTYPAGGRDLAEKCAALLQRHSPMVGKLVTPRLQKRFINDIATTSLTLGSEIDLVCIGAHLLICKYSDLPLEEAIRTGGVSDSYKALNKGFDEKDLTITQQLLLAHVGSDLETGWQIQFLQIHFLTNSKIAMAELIDEPLAAAISEVDSERFSSLVAAFGFKDAFRRYLSKEVFGSNLVRVLGGASEGLGQDEFSSVISILNGEGKIFQGAVEEDVEGFYSALKICRIAGLNGASMNKLQQGVAKVVKQGVNEPVEVNVIDECQKRLVEYDLLLDALDSKPDLFNASNASYFVHVFSGCEELKVIGFSDFKFSSAGNKSIHKHIVSLPDSVDIVHVSESQREILVKALNLSRRFGSDPVVAMTDEEVAYLSNSLSTYQNCEAALFGLALSGRLSAEAIAQVISQPAEGRTKNQNAAVAMILMRAKKLKELANIENIYSVVDGVAFKFLFRGSAYSDVLTSSFNDPDAGGIVSKVFAWAIKENAISRLSHAEVANNFSKIVSAVEPYGVDSRTLFVWLNGWDQFFKADCALIEDFDVDFVRAVVTGSDELFPTFKSGALEYYGSDECSEDDWESILLTKKKNHGELIEYLSDKKGLQLSSAYRSVIVSVVRKIVTGGLDYEARAGVVGNVNLLLSKCNQEQKNLLGTEFRSLAFGENSLAEPVAWLFEFFGHLIVDVQPASTAEVGKLMGVLEYLSQNSEGATAAISYLDERARQISDYKYSKELLEAMAVSVASLKDLSPKLYQSFAKRTDFKKIFKEIFRREKEKLQQVSGDEDEVDTAGENSDPESIEDAPKV